MASDPFKVFHEMRGVAKIELVSDLPNGAARINQQTLGFAKNVTGQHFRRCLADRFAANGV